MPPRRKVAPAKRPAPMRPVAPMRRSTARRIVMIVLALIAIEAVIWKVLWLRTHRSDKATSAPAAAGSSAARELAYPELVALSNSVKTLQQEHRYTEALPNARQLLVQHELRQHLNASMRVDYGRMLNNAAFEAGPHAPRSSFERIAFEQQALEQTQIALASAKTPRERSEAITFVGLVHEAWGFPYDAYQAFRAAVGVDPSYDIAIKHFSAYGGRIVTQRVPVVHE